MNSIITDQLDRHDFIICLRNKLFMIKIPTFMKYFGLMTMLCYCVPSENIDIINISFITQTSRACNNYNSCSVYTFTLYKHKKDHQCLI